MGPGPRLAMSFRQGNPIHQARVFPSADLAWSVVGT